MFDNEIVEFLELLKYAYIVMYGKPPNDKAHLQPPGGTGGAQKK